MERLPGPDVHNTLGLQFGGDSPASVAVMIGEVEHLFYANGLVRVDFNVVKLPVFLPDAPFLDKLVPVGSTAAPKTPLLDDLAQPGLGSDGGLEALAGGLPVTDIVHQLVHMVVKPLLALLGAPDLDPILDEPLHHKGRLIFLAPQPVKHKDEQDVELPHGRFTLDLLNGIPILRGDLKAGDALLGKLPDDVPAFFLRELMAALLLHGDVIFFNLSLGGYAVQAANPFCHSLPPVLHVLALEICAF